VILEGMMSLLRQSDEFVMAFEYSPRHLVGFGSSPRELIERLTSLRLRMFAPGPGPGAHALQAVTPRQLQRMASEETFFANLLLVRGRRELLSEIQANLVVP
jgi:hypothetical protein